MTNVAKNIAAETAPLGQRKPSEIDPKNVILDQEGQFSRSFVVRLPPDIVFGDLADPAIWTRLQSDRSKNLRKFDNVRLVSFDESWLADCVVAAATAQAATLSKPRKIDLEPRQQALFEDELYRCTWAGTGYVIVRKADGIPMCRPVANLMLATREHAALYPTRVA